MAYGTPELQDGVAAAIATAPPNEDLRVVVGLLSVDAAVFGFEPGAVARGDLGQTFRMVGGGPMPFLLKPGQTLYGAGAGADVLMTFSASAALFDDDAGA